MKSFRCVIFFAAVCTVVCGAPESAHAEDTGLLFENDVQPVLAKKCGKCHSKKTRKGELDLSSMIGIRQGGESDEPVVAETLDDSLLWAMIDGGDMPPEGQPSLTEKERSLIRRWISTGARSKTPLLAGSKSLNQHDVLPIVLLRCVTCHGARIQQAGVDLRTVRSMKKGGDSGPAIVPGDAAASLMIKRIESEACPPRNQLLKFFVKRPPPSEVKVLRDWIAAGALEADIDTDVATTEPDPLVSDEDRSHWAFQTPRASLGATSLDDFIRRKLRTQGLELSPEASRDTLIRRAYLNLVGMPPSLAELKKWRTLKSASSAQDRGWYSAMIDQLLESPRYGERWGRYWLDLAGYADSEGGTSADPIRKVAWKYRDYVIQAFNDDKPYDQFLVEQIAGDELIDHEKAAVIIEKMVENLVATGFLRMGIDQTGSRTMNFVPERIGVISDNITVLSSGLMGLTMGCARCHSHKYDAIPHRDYYRFKAIFQGAFDEHDWLTFKKRNLSVSTKERQQRVAQANPPLQAKIKKLDSRLKQTVTDLRNELLQQHYPEQPAADRSATLRALRIADNNRTQPQRILVEQLQAVEVLPDSRQPDSVVRARREVQGLERSIDLLRKQMEPALTIRAVWDRGEPSPTYILRRGEHDKPGRLVGPGVPSVLTNGRTPFVAKPPFPAGTNKTGRRLAFARWLTRPDHPLTARVMVNRIWYHHFGMGLVKSLENFGVKGDQPSHPELLDWLAVQFVKQGWSIKALHRAIMDSATYRQSSRISEDRRRLDPQNRMLSRMSLRRMDAEALRDSLLFVSGELSDSTGGPPDTVSVSREGFVSANPTADGKWRRSIYLQYRRTEIPTMMDTFDYPEMSPNCMTRSLSTVSPQSLMLMNNQHIHALASAFAARVETLAQQRDDTTGGRIDCVYELALSRAPSELERQLGIKTLNALRASWKDKPKAPLATYCHTILNSAAFLYVD